VNHALRTLMKIIANPNSIDSKLECQIALIRYYIIKYYH
jgi:hypothetical protein